MLSSILMSGAQSELHDTAKEDLFPQSLRLLNQVFFYLTYLGRIFSCLTISVQVFNIEINE